MEKGDIVIGRPTPTIERDKLVSVFDPSTYKHRGAEIWDTEITVYSHKEDYLLSCVAGRHFLKKHDERFKDFERKRISYNNVKGMIVDFDPLDAKRPHIDGIAAVLIEDKIWWIVAKHLQVIKLGQGQ